MEHRISTFGALALLAFASATSSGANAPETRLAPAAQASPDAQQLVVIEQFTSSGDEPFTWTTEVRNRTTREVTPEGGAKFTVKLDRLLAAYGGYDTVDFTPTAGSFFNTLRTLVS